IMDELCSRADRGAVAEAAERIITLAPAVNGTRKVKASCGAPVSAKPHVTKLATAPNVPEPPFWGSRIVTHIPLADVLKFINERTLFSTQWQFRKGNVAPKDYERQMREEAYPAFQRLKRQCIDEKILQPAVAYGYFPCASEGDDLIIF